MHQEARTCEARRRLDELGQTRYRERQSAGVSSGTAAVAGGGSGGGGGGGVERETGGSVAAFRQCRTETRLVRVGLSFALRRDDRVLIFSHTNERRITSLCLPRV